MRKKEDKTKYPYPYKTEEEAKASETDRDPTIIISWYTDKGTKITVTEKQHIEHLSGKIVKKLTVTEEKYIIGDDNNKTLSDKLELYPISQIKDLGSFRIVVNKKEDKVYISIPTLGSSSLLLDKNQLKLFELIFEAKGYSKIPYLKSKTEYTSDDSVIKAIVDINSKFRGVLNVRKLILGVKGKGYSINEQFRIEQTNDDKN